MDSEPKDVNPKQEMETIPAVKAETVNASGRIGSITAQTVSVKDGAVGSMNGETVSSKQESR
jgi:hypothetical protein